MATNNASWADIDEASRAAQPTTAQLAEELKNKATITPADSPAPEKKEEDDPDTAPVALSGLHPHDKDAQVHVESADKETIYRSIASFNELGLSNELLKGVLAMNFTAPSKIQAVALPRILDPKRPNVHGQAQHGSGKTAAYSLGMLSRVDENKNFPQALCVCPVRELAIQVTDVINSLAKYTKIRATAAVPSEDRSPVTTQIVVGTAGTVLGQMRAKRWDPRHIQVLVLDEADVMIDQAGQSADSLAIKKQMPKNVQILLFSATFPEKVLKFADMFAPNAEKIRIKTEELRLDSIQQFYVDAGNAENKYQLLSAMYGILQIGSSIIFVHTVATAKDLANRMRKDGFKVSLLHGKDMEPKERDAVMKDFRENRTSVLITTNVLARGVDVLHVTLVVNYELPLLRDQRVDPETYIHRIGRSGRFGRKGVAINFVHDEKSKTNLAYLERYFTMTIKPLSNDIEEMAEAVKKALGQ